MIDLRIIVIGSHNYSFSVFYSNREISMIVNPPDLAADLVYRLPIQICSGDYKVERSIDMLVESSLDPEIEFEPESLPEVSSEKIEFLGFEAVLTIISPLALVVTRKKTEAFTDRVQVWVFYFVF